MKKFNWFDWSSLVLVIIGALNWGLVGIFNFNLVDAIFGASFGRVIYTLVGLTGLYAIYMGVKIAHKEPQ